MPKGGFGNLIALPLQKEAAQAHGGSLFVDDTFLPYRDQWAYLSSVQLLDRNGLQYHIGRIQPAQGIPQKQEEEEKPLDRPIDKLPPDDKTEQLSDIEHARQSVIISSPYESAKGIREWMQALLVDVRRGIRVEIWTKELTTYKKSAASVDRALNELTGVRILMAIDTFLKYVVIDERVVWYGGMDVLGTIPPDSSVLRLTSGSIAARLVKADCV